MTNEILITNYCLSIIGLITFLLSFSYDSLGYPVPDGWINQ